MKSSRAIVRVGGREVTASSNDWRGVVASFISTQDVKESSRNLYTRTLTQYFSWLENTGRINNVDKLTRQDILEYKDYLLASNLSALTVSSYIFSLIYILCTELCIPCTSLSRTGLNYSRNPSQLCTTLHVI